MENRDPIPTLGYEKRIGAFTAWGWAVITLVIAIPLIVLLLLAALRWL